MQSDPFKASKHSNTGVFIYPDERKNHFVLTYQGLELYFQNRKDAENYATRLTSSSSISMDSPFLK